MDCIHNSYEQVMQHLETTVKTALESLNIESNDDIDHIDDTKDDLNIDADEHKCVTTADNTDEEHRHNAIIDSQEMGAQSANQLVSDQLPEVTDPVAKVMNSEISKSLATRLADKRHPLRNHWQLWFWRADPGVKVVWRQALQRVCKPFHTIEDFWCLYHHIISVKQLTPPSDYCVFKEGIEPMWEDSHNINGGKWSMEFVKASNRQIDPHLDDIWLEVLLCLIGEGFNEFNEEICGAVVNIRSKEDRISVWTANANKSVANLKIGEILKVRTGFEKQLKYEAHSTSQRIALQKEKIYDSKLNANLNPKSNGRRSCVF
ncbi:eukaryotic translation initiation factor 4E-like [Oppia nitens]|uniref:eukaryotic translation initiation factor 4E-like n=1 Tax=Oppia nitens TaxID=1686743 RepID=UPI0023DB3617|nr:eukaryotic translation initiation factor 4E-like [Oppia nitens]